MAAKLCTHTPQVPQMRLSPRLFTWACYSATSRLICPKHISGQYSSISRPKITQIGTRYLYSHQTKTGISDFSYSFLIGYGWLPKLAGTKRPNLSTQSAISMKFCRHIPTRPRVSNFQINLQGGYSTLIPVLPPTAPISIKLCMHTPLTPTKQLCSIIFTSAFYFATRRPTDVKHNF